MTASAAATFNMTRKSAKKKLSLAAEALAEKDEASLSLAK